MNNPENWYYLQQGVTVGPMPWVAMEAMARAGTIRADTLVWPGYGEWIAAGSSNLGPLFMGGGTEPAPTPGGWRARMDFLPKDKRARTVLLAIFAIIGLYAVYDGMRDVRSGMGGESGGGSQAAVNFLGCRAVDYNSVECGFQNTGSVKKQACMDVVVLCADGRHVASTCSGEMEPGESITKRVTGFQPDLQQNVPCSNMNYENWRS